MTPLVQAFNKLMVTIIILRGPNLMVTDGSEPW